MRSIIILITAILILLSWNSQALPQTDVSNESAHVEQKVDPSELMAMNVAREIANRFDYDLSKYSIIPFDKNSAKSVLEDSDIAPFVLPVAMRNDWWHILFVPRNIKDGKYLCVYIDKENYEFMGFVISPPDELK